jgi:hypothetical protein
MNLKQLLELTSRSQLIKVRDSKGYQIESEYAGILLDCVEDLESIEVLELGSEYCYLAETDCISILIDKDSLIFENK